MADVETSTNHSQKPNKNLLQNKSDKILQIVFGVIDLALYFNFVLQKEHHPSIHTFALKFLDCLSFCL